MRVLVTGATGFIGRHVVQRLLERGAEVKCLVRRQTGNDFAAPGSVEYAHGDLTQPETLQAAVRGADRVFHMAGATTVLSLKTYTQVNTEGTRHLAEACARLTNPPVVVFVSSLAAAGPAPADCPRVESQTAAPVSAYGKSKLAAEGHLKKWANQLPVTVLRPPGVYGPWDPNTIRLFRTVRSGFNVVPGRGDQRIAMIYVDDLVTALVLAADRGRRLVPDPAGPEADRGIYFVARDEFPTLTEMAHAAAVALNVPSVRTVHLPRPICWLGAYINQCKAYLSGKPVFLSPDKMREAVAGSWICSSHKAKVELGLNCATHLADGFRITAEWYLRHGWL